MTDLVTLVMQAAATEVLQEEANQIDQEVQWLLAEMEYAPVEEGGRDRSVHCLLELLKRRGEVARKALLVRSRGEPRYNELPEAAQGF
jgi:hypothetical protein